MRTPTPFLLAAAAAIWGASAQAQSPPAPGGERIAPLGVNKMITAFQDWAKKYSVSDAVMLITKDGVQVGTSDVGPTVGPHFNIDTMRPIASLSKIITGMCVMSLIDANRLAFGDTVATVLPGLTAAIGANQANAGRITVEHLLRHTSGFARDAASQFNEFGTGSSQPNPAQWFALQAFSLPLASTPGTVYMYNNVNYAILGLMIEARSGQGYEAYCKNAVLTPRGAPNARVGAGVRAMAAFGGWEITAREYMAFYLRSLDRTLMSSAARDFMDFAMAPRIGTCTVCSYSLGVTTRYVGHTFTVAPVSLARAGPVLVPVGDINVSPHNVWHFGDWQCNPGPPCNGATTPREFASFAVRWTNGFAVVMFYNTYLAADAAKTELDNNLFTAAQDLTPGSAVAPPPPPARAPSGPPAAAPAPSPGAAPPPKPIDPNEVLREPGRR